MKKLLLASAATVAFALTPRADAAEPITGSVGGYMMIGLVYQDNDTPAAPSDELGVLRDGEIHLQFEGTSDNGLTFSGRVELEAFTTADQIDENWAQVESSFGALRIGSDDSASEDHEVGVFYGPGSRTGYFDTFDSPLFSSNGGDVPMIRYSTPTFAGFAASADWAPCGSCDGALDSGLVFGVDERYSVGASWRGEFSGFSLAVGAGYLYQNLVLGGDFNTWHVGGQVGYAGFSFGVHYDSAGNAGVEDDGAVAVGAEYATGPWTFGAGVSFSVADTTGLNDETIGWGIWATYALAPGVTATLGYEGDDEDVSTPNETTVSAYLRMGF
ncbi:MAG TPA: porin [Paracoccaceae bacterium]|nr:porin [Paracoccaceae bacterium]